MATVYGDVDGTLNFKAKSQTLLGADEINNVIFGDADLIENRSGANDVLIGGTNSDYNRLYGDAYTIRSGRGGNDRMIGGGNCMANDLYGDAFEMYQSKGGNDALFGGNNSDFNNLHGDSAEMYKSQGGNDALVGGDSSLNTLYGDACILRVSYGGNDVLIGGANAAENILFGDSKNMIDGSVGGNDMLTGGRDSVTNVLNGDSAYMFFSFGGNDVLIGGSHSTDNNLYGDAGEMLDSRGGDDVLTGGVNSHYNKLYGDAFTLSASQGGNDVLKATDTPISGEFITENMLYGDAKYHFAGKAICGNDRLISGTGNDFMWGDIANSYNGTGYGDVDLSLVSTGQDIFVFSANNGTDTIHDFRKGEDKIELNGVGVTSFEALMAAAHLSQQETNTVITFGSNTITVVGVTELTASDFIFT